MKSGAAKVAIQRIAQRFGYHIRRMDEGVSFEDAYAEQQRLLKNVTVKTVFEVGAADGRDSARYCETFEDAKVYAFEPGPDSYAKIVERALLQPRLKPVNVAASNQIGIAAFNIGDWVDASSLLPSRSNNESFDKYQKSSKSVEVATTTLDAFCKENGIDRIDLLKMDVQGAERMVFEGARELLNKQAFGVILTELQFIPLYEGSAMAHDIMSMLHGHGYKIHNFYDLHYNSNGDLAWGDAIFTPA